MTYKFLIEKPVFKATVGFTLKQRKAFDDIVHILNCLKI